MTTYEAITDHPFEALMEPPGLENAMLLDFTDQESKDELLENGLGLGTKGEIITDGLAADEEEETEDEVASEETDEIEGRSQGLHSSNPRPVSATTHSLERPTEDQSKKGSAEGRTVTEALVSMVQHQNQKIRAEDDKKEEVKKARQAKKDQFKAKKARSMSEKKRRQDCAAERRKQKHVKREARRIQQKDACAKKSPDLELAWDEKLMDGVVPADEESSVFDFKTEVEHHPTEQQGLRQGPVVVPQQFYQKHNLAELNKNESIPRRMNQLDSWNLLSKHEVDTIHDLTAVLRKQWIEATNGNLASIKDISIPDITEPFTWADLKLSAEDENYSYLGISINLVSIGFRTIAEDKCVRNFAVRVAKLWFVADSIEDRPSIEQVTLLPMIPEEESGELQAEIEDEDEDEVILFKPRRRR